MVMVPVILPVSPCASARVADRRSAQADSKLTVMSRRFMVGDAPKRVEPTGVIRQGRGHYSVERQRPGGLVAAPDSRFLLCSFKGQFLLRAKDNGAVMAGHRPTCSPNRSCG